MGVLMDIRTGKAPNSQKVFNGKHGMSVWEEQLKVDIFLQIPWAVSTSDLQQGWKGLEIFSLWTLELSSQVLLQGRPYAENLPGVESNWTG